MRTPWTREQLEALRRLAGEGRSRAGIAERLGLSRSAVTGKLWRVTRRPPQRRPKGGLDGERAAALYGDGWTYVEIARRFDCSKSTVAKQLAAQGVTPRPRGRPHGRRLMALAREIVEDLAGPLGGAASAPDLVDWLGEPLVSLRPALEQLRERGLVREVDGVFVLNDRGAARKAVA
ncbi:MAG TPA: helix-turn-helix domain-containing protein [Caulobacteraceae bacterium]|jgi:DNA-binding CsgD family transcriptional regulator